MTNITYTADKEKVKSLLERIDRDFFPCLSVQLGDLDKYVKKLVGKGRIVVHEEEGQIDGLFGYFIRRDDMICDILWVSKEKRKSVLLKQIVRYVIENEADFSGRIKAKTYAGNDTMIGVLEKLGFSVTRKIENDYVSGRTSLLFETDSSKVRAYFNNVKPDSTPYGISREGRRFLYCLLYKYFKNIHLLIRSLHKNLSWTRT